MAGTNPIFSNQAWRPLHVRDCFLFERGSTKAFAGVTTVNLGLGANSNPGAFPDVPAVLAIAHDFGEASQPGNIHSIDVEQLFSFAGSTSVTANGNGPGTTTIAGVRGAVTIAAANTFASGFLYAVHGKINVQGSLSSANFLGAVCGQLDLSSTVSLTAVNLAAIVGDMGGTFSAGAITGEAGLQIMLLTSTAPGSLIGSVIHAEALSSFFLDVSNASYPSGWTAQTTVSTVQGVLAVKTPAGTAYIPCYTTKG